jgi:cyclopropane fatty-acyl-phospholipid synthase-like methyltransferase
MPPQPPATNHDMNCPACRAVGLRPFFNLPSIPTSSCVLVDTAEQARDFRRKPLSLAFCPRCGFISNPRFDPATQAELEGYEETQGFSSTFNAFARTLAQRLIDTHHLRGKTMLEIGCGKGEFVSLMCELGVGRGIGIDPLLNPRRAAESAGAVRDRVRFIRDEYGPAHGDLHADLIVCRHTLEHIADVAGFLATLRQNLVDRPTPVFFEVPDTMRILREGAFWDIYYEHCSYFTSGSLARAFRAAGFVVTDVELAYGRQYLLLTAAPGAQVEPLAIEEPAHEVVETVDRFASQAATSVAHWREVIAQREGVVLWGSGSKAVGFLSALGDTAERVAAVVDINPHKRGKYLPGVGQRIIAPAELAELRPSVVVVMNPVYREEIARDLAALRVDCELLTL